MELPYDFFHKTSDIWREYILPECDAVSLWMFSQTSVEQRAWVTALVDARLRTDGWFDTEKVIPTGVNHCYHARNGTLFWRLFSYFGTTPQEDKSRPGYMQSWAYSFFRWPTLRTLEFAGAVTTTFSAKLYGKDSAQSILRWCRTGARAVSTDEAGALVCKLYTEGVLEHWVLIDGTAPFFYTADVRHDLSKIRAKANALTLGLFTGHTPVLDGIMAYLQMPSFAALASWMHHEKRGVFLAAVLSQNLAMVQRFHAELPAARFSDTQAWCIALSSTDEICLYLQETYGFAVTLYSLIRERGPQLSRATLDRALRVAPKRDDDNIQILDAVLRHLSNSLSSSDMSPLVQWARESGFLSDSDVHTRIVPILQRYHERFGNIVKGNPCTCAAHALAHMLSDMGVPNVEADMDMPHLVVVEPRHDNYVIGRALHGAAPGDDLVVQMVGGGGGGDGGGNRQFQVLMGGHLVMPNDNAQHLVFPNPGHARQRGVVDDQGLEQWDPPAAVGLIQAPVIRNDPGLVARRVADARMAARAFQGINGDNDLIQAAPHRLPVRMDDDGIIHPVGIVDGDNIQWLALPGNGDPESGDEE